MNIVFCHGVMSPDQDWKEKTYNSTKGWKDWLQFVVEAEHDVLMQIPRFPHAHAGLMKYHEWEKIMDFQDINSDTVLIGHSAGGGFILKYLCRHPNLKVRQVILVAPWIDTEKFQPFGFYESLKLDNKMISQTEKGMDILISDDDMSYIKNSFDIITKNIPDIRVHKFSGRGHFVSSELPEIMSIIKF
jgi:pimeloyl-ACP methyl ester carboxylesterase